jgi:hypothetical protein
MSAKDNGPVSTNSPVVYFVSVVDMYLLYHWVESVHFSREGQHATWASTSLSSHHACTAIFSAEETQCLPRTVDKLTGSRLCASDVYLCKWTRWSWQMHRVRCHVSCTAIFSAEEQTSYLQSTIAIKTWLTGLAGGRYACTAITSAKDTEGRLAMRCGVR